MFLLNFSDSYIFLVKYLQRVPLDVFINWRYLHEDAGKTWTIRKGHNAMRYHNFNTLPYIFSQFNTDGP